MSKPGVSRAGDVHRLLICFALSVFVAPVVAQSLYEERVRLARPDDEALAKAAEQIKEHRDVEVLEELFVEPFHKTTPPPANSRKTMCLNCHLAPPHRQSVRSRSFLNMHTRYISCETCHLKQREGDRWKFRWLDFGALSGPGADSPVVSDARRWEGGEERQRLPVLQPRPGVKIAPFQGERRGPAFDDDPFAREIQRRWKRGTLMEKAQIKANLHSPLRRKGIACKQCHSGKGNMLDLAALGADGAKARAIEGNTIAHFFGRYKKERERLRIVELLR